jgi:DNA-binding transcriptional LysR family regulator
MELRHLRYYVAVAEELSFGRAASRLAMAQPPLSRQIRALEDEMGVRLLVRTKRRMLLTEAGASFLEGARAALAQAALAVEQARRASRGEARSSLSVAFAPSAELALMHAFLRAVARLHGTIRLDVQTCAAHEAIRVVQAGIAQLAVLPAPGGSRERDLRLEPLASRRLRVALPAKHPLARRARVTLRQLAEEPFVLFTRAVSPAIHDAVVSAFEGVGLPLRIRHETSHLQTCVELVAAGVGVSLLPAVPGRPGVAFRPLDPTAATLDFVVAYRDGAANDALREVVRTARAGLRGAARV